MSRKEIQKTWINRYERRQSRTAINNTVYLMKTGVGYELTEEDHVCPRGLEHLYDELSIECDEEAKKSQKIALAMQRLLRRTGTTSPKMIARAYFKYTIRSRRIAYDKAIRDQTEVVLLSTSSDSSYPTQSK